MQLKPDLDLSGEHWHFVGILGTGMRGLAIFASECGAEVSGSDIRPPREGRELIERGISVRVGQHRPRLSEDTSLVVASQANPDDNAQLREARKRAPEIVRYPETVGQLMDQRRGIAVAGSHGKSTTASTAAYLMEKAGLEPSYLIGADIPQLGGSSRCGSGEHLIAEACEYQRSFLHLRPEIGVITNIDREHIDYYYDMDDIREAFCDFARQVDKDGALIVNADDPNMQCVIEAAECDVLRCSMESMDVEYAVENPWRATRHTNFDIVCDGQNMGRLVTGLYGNHNIMNTLMASAACHRAGMNFDEIQEHIKEFEGVARRMQLIDDPWGVPVLSDYAHHPKEICASIEAARQRFHNCRIFVVFQPHQYSRTRAMLPELSASFDDVSLTLVSDIYAARDSLRDQEAISALDLVRGINQNDGVAYYVPEFEEIEDMVVGEVVTGDVVLVMGAGDIWQVAHNIKNKIAKKPATQIAA